MAQKATRSERASQRLVASGDQLVSSGRLPPTRDGTLTGLDASCFLSKGRLQGKWQDCRERIRLWAGSMNLRQPAVSHTEFLQPPPTETLWGGLTSCVLQCWCGILEPGNLCHWPIWTLGSHFRMFVRLFFVHCYSWAVVTKNFNVNKCFWKPL